MTTARLARIRASKSSASRIHGGAGLERRAVHGPEPAAQAARGARHRHAARVARPGRGERRLALLQPRDGRGIGALLRAEDRGRALERRADVAEDHQPRAAQAAVLLDRLERAGAAVRRRRAADADQHDLRAGVARPRRSARPCRTCSPPRRRARPRPRGAGPEAAAISTTAVPPSSTSPYCAFTGRPSGSCTSTVTQSPPRASISASIVPSPPSASGHRSGGISPARSRPRPIAPATSAARNVPLKESGATRTGRSCMRRHPANPGARGAPRAR